MLRFGLRNLLRSKLRLIAAAAAISLPVFLLLVMQAIGGAISAQTALLKAGVDNMLQLRARGSMGHVNMVGNEDILPADALDKVRGVPHVARVEPYLLAMTPTEGHNFAMVVGVNPGDTKRLESHGEAGSPRIIAGRDLTDADRGQRLAIIGQGFARWAGITPENLEQATLTLDLGRTHPVIFALERPPATLKIVGIYASGYVFGDMQLFMPLDTFREIYGVREGISWLFVKADSVEHLREVEGNLRAALGEVADIIAPTTVAEFESVATRAVLNLSRAGQATAGALMVVIVFFLMLLMVRERSVEIGTLKALGAPDRFVVSAYFVEAVGLCAVGGALGLALFAAWGSAAADRLFGLGIGPFLPAQYRDTLADSLALAADIGPATLAGVVIACAVAAIAGAAYGLRAIAKLSPMEAVRYE